MKTFIAKFFIEIKPKTVNQETPGYLKQGSSIARMYCGCLP